MTRSPSWAAPTATALLLVTLTAGCSGGDGSEPAESPSSSSSAPAAEQGMLTTKSNVRTVTGGRLRPADRTRVRDQVTAVVDAWFEAAYLGGDYPRTDFDDAFAVFTAPARVRAREDRKLLSNQAVGTTTYAVRALARRVEIDVLTSRGRPAAATAQFRLGMARAGESGAERTERVSGHLYLTRDDGRWRVFGYDVQRGVLS